MLLTFSRSSKMTVWRRPALRNARSSLLRQWRATRGEESKNTPVLAPSDLTAAPAPDKTRDP
jgi:hypothetical protein